MCCLCLFAIYHASAVCRDAQSPGKALAAPQLGHSGKDPKPALSPDVWRRSTHTEAGCCHPPPTHTHNILFRLGTEDSLNWGNVNVTWLRGPSGAADKRCGESQIRNLWTTRTPSRWENHKGSSEGASHTCRCSRSTIPKSFLSTGWWGTGGEDRPPHLENRWLHSFQKSQHESEKTTEACWKAAMCRKYSFKWRCKLLLLLFHLSEDVGLLKSVIYLVRLAVHFTVGGDERVTIHIGHQISRILQKHAGLLWNPNMTENVHILQTFIKAQIMHNIFRRQFN